MKQRLKIGISASVFYPHKERSVFSLDTLQCMEQTTAHWLMQAGAMPVLIPAPAPDAGTHGTGLADYVAWLDGLILSGGVDLSPGSYGETVLRPEWQGDPQRDQYEIALLKAFCDAGKPVLGICRGMQLINVAFGGTLYQDLATQCPEAIAHRYTMNDAQFFHPIQMEPGSRLAQLVPQDHSMKVNSVHHQGIKRLAPGFAVEARCPDDRLIEAIRCVDPTSPSPWLAGVQWHPEFHKPALGVMDDAPLLRDFLTAARAGANFGHPEMASSGNEA